jgi:hypothetical protein
VYNPITAKCIFAQMGIVIDLPAGIAAANPETDPTRFFIDKRA